MVTDCSRVNRTSLPDKAHATKNVSEIRSMGHFTEVFGRGDGPLYCWPLQVEMDDAFSFVSPCDWVDAPRSFALPPRIQNLAVRQA